MKQVAYILIRICRCIYIYIYTCICTYIINKNKNVRIKAYYVNALYTPRESNTDSMTSSMTENHTLYATVCISVCYSTQLHNNQSYPLKAWPQYNILLMSAWLNMSTSIYLYLHICKPIILLKNMFLDDSNSQVESYHHWHHYYIAIIELVKISLFVLFAIIT